MKQLLNKSYSQTLAVLWNVLLVYVVYMIGRLAYYVENLQYFNFSFDTIRGGYSSTPQP